MFRIKLIRDICRDVKSLQRSLYILQLFFALSFTFTYEFTFVNAYTTEGR